jgi:membrane protein implicated in regulation of membrane protease activity
VATLKGGNDLSGVVSILLSILVGGAGLVAAAGAFFQKLPWWVSAVVFLSLFLYGLLRASYEEVKEKERAQEELREKKGRLYT